MFIKAIKKAIASAKAEQHTSKSHPGLVPLLNRVMKSNSPYVRKPIDWKQEGGAVSSMWFRQKEVAPLEAALKSADTSTRVKWAKQVLSAAEALNCDCNAVLYDVKIFVDQNNDIVLDVSGCHNPLVFAESPDRRSNRVAFWLVMAPYLPAEGGWRNTFSLQQWLGETLYQIFEETDKVYTGCLLNWFYAAQSGSETVNHPTYNEPQNVSPELAAVLRKLLCLRDGRYSSLSAAIGAAQIALKA